MIAIIMLFIPVYIPLPGADPGIFRRGGQLYSVRHIHTDKRVLNADGIPLCLTVSSLVPRLSVKREMWGRKGEPGFYCRPDPSHSGGFGFPPYFPVFDFIIIIILSNQRFFVQDGEFVSESVSSSVSSSDSSSHYPQALSHALSMLGLPELLLKEEQKLSCI